MTGTGHATTAEDAAPRRPGLGLQVFREPKNRGVAVVLIACATA